ncbi:restriction endonuclease subunit S [Polynucleobacter paneuropaeus]|nr:restriction endonuclease subunit S [Polynucleobacter paneuropaeus]MBT8554166.1 restriction endonuclease subunit S [Polynucleobacter paneuropaeus]MBT8559444.1 restriction endonuclease subunit S [Polynucleobacter paneuropaeus]
MSVGIHARYQSYKDSGEGWISEIPAHWETRKLKQLFYEKKHQSNMSLNCGAISFGEVIEKDDEQTPLATKASYQEVLAGEVLINPLNLNYDLKSLRIALSKINVMVSAGYIVLLAKPGIDKEYFKYLLHRYDVAYMKLLGSGVRQTISFNHIANSLLIVPPISEQRLIADFLNQKCAKIDEAIKIKGDQIALLRERRQVITQEAVTRGLNPDAPMKDSGIDWVGQIPMNWECIPNKYLFKLKKATVGKRSSEYDLLSLTLRGVIKRDMENPEGKFPADFDTYQEVSPGDFIFCHFDVEETPRTVGLSDFFGMITGAYTVYSVVSGVDPRFLLHFYIFADTDKKMRSMYTGLRNTIPKEAFGAFKMPLPPIEEQRAIVAHIDDASRKIEDSIKIKEQQIAALTEYKTCLIDSAVTGKIKVT